MLSITFLQTKHIAALASVKQNAAAQLEEKETNTKRMLKEKEQQYEVEWTTAKLALQQEHELELERALKEQEVSFSSWGEEVSEWVCV